MTWQQDYVRSIAEHGYKLTSERLVAEVGRLRALTVDDPTSIYHEHERLRKALEAIALGRCDGHLHHPAGSPPCPYRTPTAYARSVLSETSTIGQPEPPTDRHIGPDTPTA